MVLSQSDASIPTPSTLVELLHSRATSQPDQNAYTFLLDGETESIDLTYGELDQQAWAIAALLHDVGATGERALLIYPPGLAYIAAFFGCLYAGVVAVPAYPPHPARIDRILPRLRAIVKDAQPRVALTTGAIASLVEPLFTDDADFGAIRWVATDTPTIDRCITYDMPGVTTHSLAFLQYTSGSTSTPKGVMLTHGNLIHNLKLIHHAFGHSANSRGVIWLPPYHDMGLIGGILQPLYGGFPVTLMSPVHFLQRPIRWLQAISRTQATSSGGPNFAYDLCVRKIAPEQRAALDLSHWTVAFNGAEPIRSDTLARFTEAFASCGFRNTAWYPCYGLAEATLLVSGGQQGTPPVVQHVQAAALAHNHVVVGDAAAPGDHALIGSGQAMPEHAVVIADPTLLSECQPGHVGEIWVAGPSVAQGYWNRPVETAQTFQARLPSTEQPAFLRTGDLGFVLDGQLFITGRLKDLIIIRGHNYYPQDIELTVERSHPALRPAGGAAFTVDLNGTDRLVVVQEVERQHRRTDLSLVTEAIRQAVAEQHELHLHGVVLVRPGSVPKTSSGKIQRYLCRSQYLNGSLDIIASSILAVEEDAGADWERLQLTQAMLLNVPESQRLALVTDHLRDRLAQLLGMSASEVDPARPVSTLGLDSLMAVELQHGIESDLDVSVPMVQFLQESTLSQVATTILDRLATSPAGAKPLLEQMPAASGEYPLSAGQQALWFLHQLAPESAAYNLPFAVTIRSELDIPALRCAFQRLIDRHPALRTTFVQAAAAQGESVVQRVHAQWVVPFQAEDASQWDTAILRRRLLEETQRPFDLEHGPLHRITLFTRSAHEHIILLTTHHIVVDLWSLALLLNELGTLYTTEQSGLPAALPAPTRHYTDYVHWQAALLAGEAGARLLGYWQKQLADAPTVLELPTDRPRPPIQSYRGATHTFKLDAGLTRHINAFAKAHGTTLYTTLLAAFQALIYRYTGQDDFLIGSPTTGREHAQFVDIVGYFVNPVVLRARLSADQPFTALLSHARLTVLEALAHQSYPFPLLVERLQPERDASRTPLFQIMFVFQKTPLPNADGVTAFALGHAGTPLTLGNMTAELFDLEQAIAQFDLTLTMGEVAGALAGSFQYNADLFDASTIARMAGHLQALLKHSIADPDCSLADLPLLTDAEREQVLVTWNATSDDFPNTTCIHQLFEAQAVRTPDAVALVVGDSRLTYHELNQRANRLAQYLQQLGIGPEVPVGICIDRSAEMVIGLLAILKAGGAYVPLDPAYPAERLAFMLADVQAPVLLSQRDLLASIPECTAQIVCIDTDWAAIAQASDENPLTAAASSNLAYVIYTSGSTGRPKGAMITHRNAVAMLAWAQKIFTSEQRVGVLAATSICFDLSVFELFVPLSWGGTIILVKSGIDLPTQAAAQQVTLINTVPSVIAELLRMDGLSASVRTVNLAGEPLGRNLVQELYQRDSIQQVFNLYGPSEDTTYSSFTIVPKASDDAPSIGRPIANTQCYVLDSRLQPTPIGVVGELYIAGEGLARGYVGLPELTAEKFIPNPFATTPGSRLYKTGDLVRYRSDGTLMFLGRIDHQVKVRGFRIELGEIEAAILQHPGVWKATVVVREDAPGDKRLVAYIVPAEIPATRDGDQPSGTEQMTTRSPDTSSVAAPADPGCLADEVRRFLQIKLPSYILPSAFVELAALPLTPNGKIDRKQLPIPERSGLVQDQTLAASRTPLEETLASMWVDLLNLEQVGIYDNFFALGGHSLLAIQVLSRVRATLEIDVPVQRFFQDPTINGLGKNIEMMVWAKQNAYQVTTIDDDREEGSL